MNADPEWLTTPEVAELLRVSVRTIHDWRQTHVGPPAYRVGRQLLWKRHEVTAWVEQQRDANEPATAAAR